MLAVVMRRLTWKRRVQAAHAWRDAERAEYLAAMERILDQDVRDPAGRRTGRAA